MSAARHGGPAGGMPGAAPPPAEPRPGTRPRPDVRVVLPEHLRTLAGVGREVSVTVAPPVTLKTALDALEARYPVLRGAIRHHGSLERRAFVRFFAVGRDLSHEPPDTALPAAVVGGEEPLVVIGAMAGG